jgi:hypothetical protein
MERDAKLTIVARAVHETMRAYQHALHEAVAPPWDESDRIQASTREAVELALTNPTPGAQHEAWCIAKRRDGWHHGPTKDAALKTHPSLVPFEDLSETEKLKDELLIAVVQALAPPLGL